MYHWVAVTVLAHVFPNRVGHIDRYVEADCTVYDFYPYTAKAVRAFPRFVAVELVVVDVHRRLNVSALLVR
jgi:hypothetical protein